MPARLKFNYQKLLSNALRRWYWVLAASLVLAIGVGISLAMQPLQDADGRFATRPYGLTTALENSALNLMFQMRDVLRPAGRTRGTQEPITIIAIDEKSIANSGVRLQGWSRASYARLIDIAAQRGAAVIGLDVILDVAGGTSAADTAGDEQLVTTIENAGNVVIVEKLEAGGTPAITPLQIYSDAAYAVGFADLPHDSDGFVRAAQLVRSRKAISSNPLDATTGEGSATQAEANISFPVRVTEGYLLSRYVAEDRPVENFYEEQGLKPIDDSTMRIGTRTLPLRTDSTIQLDFRARSPAFTNVSATDLLASDPAQIPDDLFRDRIVLIGATTVDAPDLFFTPFFEPNLLARFLDSKLPVSPVKTPGVELHATTIATMLWGRALSRPTYTWQVFSIAIPLVLAALTLFALRAIFGAFLVLLIAVGTLVFSIWMFDTHAIVLPLASAWLGLGVLTPTGLALRYAHERALRDEKEAERALLMDIFSRCVSENVADTLWQQRDKLLSGERRTVSIIFTDIRGFTTISERMPSLQLVEILNDYFSRMNAIVDHHGGHINKFIGDGLMIVFGAPVSRGDTGEAWSAVACGLEMLQEVVMMNEEAEALGRPRLQIGVGIHTGEAVCGVIGSARRLEYTVIGDTVNLAARLESTTKEFDVPLLISEATARLVDRRYKTRPLGQVTVKGKTASTALYTVVERRQVPRFKFAGGIRKTAGNKLPKFFPAPKADPN